MDLRVYSKSAIEDFINTYRQCECLWNVKSKDYSHKNKRNGCYDKLLAVLKTTDQDANKETVVKKINSLRASYRKERKKTRESRSGSGAAEVYNTKLWYFKLLDFLDDSSPILPTRDNLNETQDSSTQDSSTTETNYSDVVYPASDIISSQPSKINKNKTSSNRKRRADTPAADDLLDTLNNQLNSDLFNVREDEYDAVGKNIAAKLRKLPETTRILAEKLLNDVMFAAQMNTITMDTGLYTSQSDYSTFNNDNI